MAIVPSNQIEISVTIDITDGYDVRSVAIRRHIDTAGCRLQAAVAPLECRQHELLLVGIPIAGGSRRVAQIGVGEVFGER